MAANAREASFWDHLDELRKVLIRAFLVLVAVSAGLFFFKEFLFDGLILAPTRPDFFLYRALGINVQLNLVNIEVTAQFMTHIKVTFICAAILCCPYLLYETWGFIAPALYDHEKRSVRGAFLLSSVLFYLGLAIGYSLVLPLMVNFFQGYSVSASVVNTISLSSYMSMVYSTVLLFGLVFELPVLVALLSRLGIITREAMLRGWRYAVAAVIVLAALITPSGDPFSLMVVSIPLFLLYILSVFVCRREVAEV